MYGIAWADRNWGIGKDGKMPVSIPKDMAFFQQMTTGGIVIMGRKTLESFPNGRPLKNRLNIVITRKPDYACEGAVIVHSVEEAAEAVKDAKEKVFVIGGGSIYRQMLPYMDTVYLTKVDYAYDVDAFFPNLDEDPEWELVEEGEEDTFFDLIFRFDVYQRKK